MKEKRKQFFLFLLIGTGVLFFYSLGDRVNSYNATLLAFSYQYGFIPRGFIGTIYQGLNALLPINLQTYGAVNGFVLVTTVGYSILIVLFCTFVLHRVYQKTGEAADGAEFVWSEGKDGWHSVWNLILFFVILAVPTFAGYYNFGRVDMYLVLLSMLAVVLLVTERAMWLLAPMAAVGVMIHEGYVFMYLNVVLVLLLYKLLTAWEQQGAKSRKVRCYGMIFLSVLFLAALLFFYFYFFSHQGGEKIYDEIIRVANSMSYKNKCHKDVVRAEILGVDLTAEEWEYHVQNFVELPFFLLLMSPFLWIAVSFFRALFGRVRGNPVAQIKYFFVAAGALTTLPLFIMKVDYGRWCFAALAYYCLVLLALFAMGDAVAGSAWEETMSMVRRKWVHARLLLGYLCLITPLCDLSICKFTYLIYNFPEKIAKMLGI